MFVFDIEDGIDLVRFQKWAKAIFKAKARKQGAFVTCVLPVEVEL
jgi:hypothetical protein